MVTKIKNLEQAAERIKKAALGKERIIIYGDSDAAGGAMLSYLAGEKMPGLDALK